MAAASLCQNINKALTSTPGCFESLQKAVVLTSLKPPARHPETGQDRNPVQLGRQKFDGGGMLSLMLSHFAGIPSRAASQQYCKAECAAIMP